MANARKLGEGDKFEKLTADYCENSSIHGIKYVVSTRDNNFIKLWWIAAILVSIFCCGRLIHNAYHKWDRSPVIVTFNEKSTPVWQIPFPALTICPETKVTAKYLNFTTWFNKYAENANSRTIDQSSFFHNPTWNTTPNSAENTFGDSHPAIGNYRPVGLPILVGENNDNMDDPHVRFRRSAFNSEEDRFKAVAQVCNPTPFYAFDLNQDYDSHCVDFIRSSSVGRNEMLMACRWRNSDINCDVLFSETLTEEGPCYTFNGLSADQLLRQEELHKDYVYIDEYKSSSHWSLEKGYVEGTSIETHPVRVLGAGPRAGIKVLLTLNDADIEYTCKGPVPGFRVLLHSPSEYPQVSKQYYLVPLDQEVLIMLKPQMITTSDGLRDYDPHRRQCYFNSERQLKYFKIYTQQNCELECTTNYTRQQCGCVRFSMPRDNKTRICGASKIECYNDAEDQLLTQAVEYTVNKSKDFWAKCDCLPACTSILYEAEISQAQHNSKALDQSIKSTLEPGTRMAQLTIYFKESQFVTSRRAEMYGLTDFLANCGGLLGLFMGFSLLSIVEIFYFCLIRPFGVLWTSLKTKKPAKVASLPPTASIIDNQTYRIILD